MTGRPPTPATTPTNLRDYNPKLGISTEQVIIRAMSRDMDARPQTASAFEKELQRSLGVPYEPMSMDPPAQPRQPLPPSPTPGRIQPLQGIAAASATSPGVGGHAGVPVPIIAQQVAFPGSAPSQPITDTNLRTCMVCGATNQTKAHFCGRCGASLAGRPPGKIQVLGPNGVLWERRILENPFNIGRRSLSRQIFPHLDLTYNDPAAYVSRQHARIVADAGGYFVEDLGSANGSYLNDRRLPSGVPTRLRNGDRVRIGKVQLNFILGG